MPTIEERAMALLQKVARETGLPVRSIRRDTFSTHEALCRALEAHDATLAEFDAYKREVSDSVEHYLDQWRNSTPSREVFACQFGSFILPKPVDPLVEAMREMVMDEGSATVAAWKAEADRLRAALAKRGLKLVEVGDAD